jgi:hypothetical protein
LLCVAPVARDQLTAHLHCAPELSALAKAVREVQVARRKAIDRRDRMIVYAEVARRIREQATQEEQSS